LRNQEILVGKKSKNLSIETGYQVKQRIWQQITEETLVIGFS